MPAGIGDRAHAAERHAGEPYLAIALGAHRLHHLGAEALDDISVQVVLTVRIDGNDIHWHFALTQYGDEAVLEEVFRPRPRGRKHDHQAAIAGLGAVKEHAHGD